MSCILNAQTALPDMLLGGVVNVPYISWALRPPYTPSINSVVDSGIEMDVKVRKGANGIEMGMVQFAGETRAI